MNSSIVDEMDYGWMRPRRCDVVVLTRHRLRFFVRPNKNSFKEWCLSLALNV